MKSAGAACGREGRRRRRVAAGARRRDVPARFSGSTRADASRAPSFFRARWDLMPPNSYMWASVQTLRGCPKHCSFCSVWRTDGQKPRPRTTDAVVAEIVELRQRGFRFIALADDNFYPVPLADLKMAARRADPTTLNNLTAIRNERFELMGRLAKLPGRHVFFTQITMEASEDPEFLAAMRRARIKGALVGVESVTAEGLKDILQAVQRVRRRAREEAARVQGQRRPRARVVHLRASERRTGHVRRDGRARAGRRRDVRAVRHAHAVSGHARLRGLGKITGPRRHEDRRRAHHPALADPAGRAVPRCTRRTRGCRPTRFASGRRASGTSSTAWRNIWERSKCVKSLKIAARLRADLEALPADVRQHRHRHRQRAGEPVGPVGAAHREALPPALRGQADAGSADTGIDHLLFVIGYWPLGHWSLRLAIDLGCV